MLIEIEIITKKQMISLIKLKLISIAEIAHLRIFGHEMSEEMRKFLEHLSWSFFGGIIAAGMLFILNVLAGRWLGPEEYGKYNLIIVISQFFLIPMLFGMDTTIVRKISMSSEINEKKKFISSAIFFVMLAIAITSIVVFLNRELLAKMFSMKIDLVIFSLIFTVSLTLKMIYDGIIKGFHFFKFQAIIRIIEGMTIVLGFFGLRLIFTNYLQLTLAFVFSYLIVSIVYIFYLRKTFGFPDLQSIKKLLAYSKFVFIGSVISFIVLYGDRFVINKYFGIKELGIYSAYYTATILVVSQFILIVTNVFFAMIAKVREKNMVMRKIDKISLAGLGPITFLTFSIGFVVLKFFGSEYKINFLILFLFGFVAALQFFVSLYANMVNAHSEKTYFWGLIFFSLRAFLYLIYIFILIIFGKITIPAILVGLAFNYIIDIINSRYIIKKYA